MATEAHITAPRHIASMNPATGELLAEFPCASPAEVQVAVEAGRRAQPAWQRAGVQQRAQVLRRFQRCLQEKKTEVARTITREAGKPYVEALLTEVLVTLDAAGFCASEAPALLLPQPVPHANPAMKSKTGRLLRQPYGVVGIISPWNYPFSIPASEVLAALVMGNAVVLKPSEFTPLAALELKSLLEQAGVPKDVFQVVLGDGATGAALVASSIDKLIFTGSVATGRKVARAAGERLLPVVLELGGKDPMLVLDDADVEVASSAAVWGAFVNAGQTCLSVERCYVHRSLYEKFVAACAGKARRLRMGNGLDAETEVGPLIHQRQLAIVEEHVADAVTRGAQVLAGGASLPELGANFYAPTVLVGVRHEMRIMREETFGPVLPIAPFDTEEEAVRLANDSEFGLAASVWTRHPARGEALAARLNAGTVMVNDAVTCFGISEAPHGGIKASGLGRTHGRMGLEEMARLKYVDSDRLPGLRKVWWYGYGAGFERQMEGFVDSLFARGLLARLRGGLRSAGALFRGRKI
jgi:acyl-CoA reductase-like NAD-dependent aldehyde dehydrogenase